MMSGQDSLKVAIDTIDHGAYDYIIKGESAYLRAQMIIDHIIESINMERWSTAQKRREAWLIIFIVILFIAIIALGLYDRDVFS